MKDCLVAFGSNLGNRHQIFRQAGELVSGIPGVENFCCSNPLTTKQVGGRGAQNNFINACFRFDYSGSVKELFAELVRIESELGRIRNERWGSRKIDLDLLLFGSEEIAQANPSIVIPHPRMSFRRFVLQPAMDIASDMVVPTCKLTIVQLLNRIETGANSVFLAKSSTEKFDSESSVIRKMCQKMGWRYGECCSAAEIHELQDDIKLLIGFGNDDAEFLSQVRHFPGATLMLSDPADASISLEIAAAIEAMESL